MLETIQLYANKWISLNLNSYLFGFDSVYMIKKKKKNLKQLY